MNHKMVSVIMPTYNCGQYIAESISSIQSQTYENWELWIVDDHSTDETAAVVEPFLSDPIGNSTVIYDRNYYGDRQVPLIRKRNDFALWLQLLRDGSQCYGMDDVLMDYRVRRQSVSSNKLGLAKYHWKLYHHIEKRNIIVSALGVFCWAFVKGTGIGYVSEKI